MRNNPAFIVTSIVILLIGQLEGMKSAPVPHPFAKHKMSMSPPAKYGSDKLITVVFLSCAKQGQHEVSIEPTPGQNRCVNVHLESAEATVLTKPVGLHIRVFDKQDCTGNSVLYDSNSSHKLPFKVESFLVD